MLRKYLGNFEECPEFEKILMKFLLKLEERSSKINMR